MQQIKSRARFILVMVIWIVMVCPMAMFLFQGFAQDAPLSLQNFSLHIVSAIIGFAIASAMFSISYLANITSWKTNILLLFAYMLNGLLVAGWLGFAQSPLFNLTLIMVFCSTFLFWPFMLQNKKFEEGSGTQA